ncbi:CD225/dispanin family protein [uncultured Apibacter sp.]|uniref:CD225/dispanin family protein n=1 Tax=uncultured Apibacter sp. TaxID=1778616 RepID=UPI0025D88781|nr:CD225/dispanin family protein [uncultured Apibacter sp.]
MSEEVVDQENDEIPKDKAPNNYLVFAIICSIACFAPVGIFALFYSLRVNQYWEQKMYSKSKRSSAITRLLCIWTIIAGIIFWMGILSGAIYNIFGQKSHN